MLRAIEGVGVLVLLSLFFAYLLAPAEARLRRLVRTGGRNRPVSRAVALAILYAVLFVPAALAWRFAGDGISRWVHVTAPAAVDHLFSGSNSLVVGYIEREARSTLQDLIAAAPHAPWLLVAPVLAFLLLTLAPSFRRSTLRLLPRGHLQWRTEAYLQDVNSALAGYVRAQTAAGVIVGVVCVAGFALLQIPSAVSLGVAAGVLELVPAIGPMTALLITLTQAGDRLLAVLAFLGALRLVQDYVIYPRLVRHGMHLSTPAVILTIWIGAVLGGAAGVILAIPVAGFLSVSLRHWREYREIERLVRGHRGTDTGTP